MKTVAIIQSNYIPWKGYFDIINDADLFIIDDYLQYTKYDWRNRNKIKTPQGTTWLTIPVGTSRDRLISEVELKDRHWTKKHWRQLEYHYKKTPHFKDYEDFFRSVYLETEWDNLSKLNQFLIKKISKDFLGIETEFKDASEYTTEGAKLDLLLNQLQEAGADRYVSGPAARDYIDDRRFAECGIELVYKDYSGYPEYPQRFPPFEHQVTILDLLFNCGPDAPYFIWGWREEARSG